MMGDSRTTAWPDDRIEQMGAMLRAGATGDEIGARLGVSKNAVWGMAHRLRAAGDARVPAKRDQPARPITDTTGLSPIDALAEVIADGCPNLVAAAKRLKMTGSEAQRLWARICLSLGSQAR